MRPPPGGPGDAAPAPTGVVVAHVSDVHLGAHDQDALESLVEDVHAVRPCLTVVTGDLTMRARAGELAAAAAFLGALPAPRLVVPGNHDVPLRLPERLRSPYARYRTAVGGLLEPAVAVPGVRALGLASTPGWRWKGGRATRRQVAEVVGVLGTAPPGAVRVLALHHPVLPGGPGGVVGRDALLGALAAARVDVVLAGHQHRPSVHLAQLAAPDGDARHVVQVVAGTGASRRTRGTGRSWMVLRVDADEIRVDQRRRWGHGWQAVWTARFPRQGGR